MRNSGLLKWAQNNRNNKLTNGRTKEESGKNWVHSSDALLKGHVVYLVKFLGCTEVDKPKGIEVVKQGIQKLKFSHQLKKAEGTKISKVELTISVDGVAIQEPKTKRMLHQYQLHKISYCADDKAEKRFFSFIAKEDNRHTCFVFVSDKLAEEITLTIGQAFELAYKRFLDTSGKDLETRNKFTYMQKRITVLEHEIGVLKSRLRDIANIKGMRDIQSYLDEHKLTDICQIVDLEEAKEAPVENNNDNLVNGTAVMTTNSDSTAGNELICLEEEAGERLDGFTLDDLNDDDFNPRDEMEFDPRASSPPQTEKLQTPMVVSPPALPPRDPNKVNNNVNPFYKTTEDPFGMSAFDMSTDRSSSAPIHSSSFSLEELDPLKN